MKISMMKNLKKMKIMKKINKTKIKMIIKQKKKFQVNNI